MLRAIYPGSFDPVTKGHLNVIYRAANLFDTVVVGVLINQVKPALFTPQEKIEMIEELMYDYSNVTVKLFSGLLVDFIREEKANAVVRGIRNAEDFLYERQLSLLNHSLYPEMEEIFLFTDKNYSYVSSSFAREVASYGGDVSGMVTENVARRLREKFQ